MVRIQEIGCVRVCVSSRRQFGVRESSGERSWPTGPGLRAVQRMLGLSIFWLLSARKMPNGIELIVSKSAGD